MIRIVSSRVERYAAGLPIFRTPLTPAWASMLIKVRGATLALLSCGD
jgi:hypothetical protein